MSCFWDGLRRKIPNLKEHTKNAKEVLSYFQEHNVLCTHVEWQSEPLSASLQNELFQHIKDYDGNVTSGHLTSSCDAFLVLACELFDCNIDFRYMKSTIRFRCKKDNGQIGPLYQFSASSSHFS